MSQQLRIISDKHENGQPLYDRIWHINPSADPVCLSKNILGGSNSSEVQFWVLIDGEDADSCLVYLEDVIRVLQAGKRTAWLPLLDEHPTTLIIAAAPQTELVKDTDYTDADEAAAERRKLQKIVRQVASFLLQRRSEVGHTYLPFWEQQVWCRHLAVRILVVKIDRPVNVVWPVLCQ